MRIALVVVGALLVGVACTADTEELADPVRTDTVAVVGDFCTAAGRFVADPSVTDVSGFSAEFFVDVDRRLSAMAESADPAVRDDVETLRAGFGGMDKALAEFDYDLEDPALPVALAQVDNEAMLAATAAIEQYVADECGEPAGATDPQQVVDIQDAFGVDRELAECLNRELGDIANIDAGQLTPELMGRPVCGTSVLALLAGAPPDG